MECGEAVEKVALAGLQVGLDEFRSANRNAQRNNTTSCQGECLVTNTDRGIRGKGKHTRSENASGIPNLFSVLAALRRRRA